MAKRGRIPKETKEKKKRKSMNLLSETIYMVVYHSKQSQNARRTKKRSRCGPRIKRETLRNARTVYSFHLCTVFSFLYFIALSCKKRSKNIF
jgi:hypothetical protein